MTAPHRTHRAGPRIALVAVAVAAALLVPATCRVLAGGGSAAGAAAGPDAAVVRGGARVARIERVVQAKGRGRLPVYHAPARGAVADSARVGALVPRLLPAAAGADPLVALVPPDSVAGLVPVGRLVVTTGESGLLVFGDAAPVRAQLPARNRDR